MILLHQILGFWHNEWSLFLLLSNFSIDLTVSVQCLTEAQWVCPSAGKCRVCVASNAVLINVQTYVALQVILALLIAYTVAAFVRHEGDKFVDGTDIKNSSNGTFFWVHTFNLGMPCINSCQGSLCLKELMMTSLLATAAASREQRKVMRIMNAHCWLSKQVHLAGIFPGAILPFCIGSHLQTPSACYEYQVGMVYDSFSTDFQTICALATGYAHLLGISIQIVQ